MGGFVSSLGEAAERGLQKLTSKMEEGPGRRFVLSMAGNQEWELDLTPGGQAIKKMQNEYIRLHDEALAQETNKLVELRKWHQSDAAAGKALPIKNATIGDYHAHAVATNHPIQKVTQSILDSDIDKTTGVSNNLGLTQREMMIKNERLARLKALDGSYGSNFENAAPIIAKMRLDKDPRIVDHAQRVADIISNQVRDTKLMRDYQGGFSEQSYGKMAMNKQFMAYNKLAEDFEGPQIGLLKTDKTYTKPEEWEREAHRVLDTIMLPLLAVKHVGQFYNLPASSPITAVGASLLRMNHAEMEHTVEASGIIASTLWRTMYQDILGETGRVAEWTKSPTLGKILGRSIHEPLFPQLRRIQLNTAGSVGFHSAIYWARNFAESGSKIAAARLREMEIDPSDVLKQGGKLTDEQLRKGVYHYTNNRMFFQKSIDNSLFQNQNVWTRAGFMYHSFVNSQAAYMRRELLLMAKAGDIKGLAQFAGTLLVLFPHIAPLIGGLETMLRTGSAKQAKDDIEKKYNTLYHPSGVEDWMGNYITLLSHLGAAGVYFNYMNAIKANRFAASMAGPLLGAIGTDAYDIYRAVTKPEDEKAREPLKRDILKQTIPVIGAPLSHMMYPTKAEQPHSRRSRGFRLHKIGRRR